MWSGPRGLLGEKRSKLYLVSMVSIKLAHTNLRMLVKTLAALNVASLLGTTLVLWAYPRLSSLPPRFSSATWGMVFSQLNLASENVAVTWYSSMLLFTAGVFALLCYLSSVQTSVSTRKWFLPGWVFIAMMFFLLSLDELGSIHENAGRLSGLDILGDNSWESVLAIPGIVVVTYLFAFGWIHLRKYPLTFGLMAVGTSLFATVPFQEHLEFALIPEGVDPENYARPIYLVLLEEGAELFGSLAFIASMIVYLRANSHDHSMTTLHVSGTTFHRTLWIATVTLCLVLLFFHFFAPALQDDDGIAVNWFPSVMVMFTGVLYALAPDTKSKIFVLIYSSLLSCYFGANFYPLLNWFEIAKLVWLVRIVMIPGLFAYIYVIANPVSNSKARLIIYVSALLVMPAFFITSSLVTISATVGMSGIVTSAFGYSQRLVTNTY